jgi:hypothetical protein
MARLFIDGFETGDLQCWDLVHAGAQTAGVAAGSLTGFGSYMLKDQGIYTGSNAFWVAKNISPSNPAVVYIKVYYQFATNNAGEILWVANSQGNQLALCLESNGTVSVRKGQAGGTIVAQGTTLLTAGTPYLIEVYFNIGSSGAIQTKINGVLDINFSGNTQNQSNNTISQICLGNNNGEANGTSSPSYWDHLVVDDANWIGNGHIVPLTPSGAGSETQLTPSTGSNYSCVNSVPGSDSKFVSGNANGLADTYAVAQLPSGLNTVNCIQILKRGEGQGAPAVGGVEDVFYIGGTYYYGSRQTVPLGALANVLSMYAKSPATGQAWGISEINGMDVGLELVT